MQSCSQPLAEAGLKAACPRSAPCCSNVEDVHRTLTSVSTRVTPLAPGAALLEWMRLCLPENQMFSQLNVQFPRSRLDECIHLLQR